MMIRKWNPLLEAGMKRSSRNHQLQHQIILSLSLQDIYSSLMDHYLESARNIEVDSGTSFRRISFERGSALGFGNTLRCRHFMNIDIKRTPGGQTLICWSIHMKRGDRAHRRNVVISECEQISEQLKASQNYAEPRGQWSSTLAL